MFSDHIKKRGQFGPFTQYKASVMSVTILSQFAQDFPHFRTGSPVSPEAL